MISVGNGDGVHNLTWRDGDYRLRLQEESSKPQRRRLEAVRMRLEAMEKADWELQKRDLVAYLG